jgi:membrane protease YdiL (CAAX protease family)
MANSIVTKDPQETRVRSPLLGWVKRHSLAAFFLLTFGYSGLLMFPVLASSLGWLPFHIVGLPALLLQLLAVWGPTLSAILLTALISGRAGLRELLSRLIRWRVGVQWYAFVLLSWPAIILAALALLVLFGGTVPSTIQLTPWYSLPFAFLINFPLFLFVGGPLGEEVGWRGYALPRLLTRHSALLSSLLVGMIWAVWHLPLFWIPGTGSGSGLVDFTWFFLLLSAWGVLLGWVYINTRGSLLLCVLYHAAGNTITSAVLPVGGHDRLMTLVTALTWGVVILVVIFAGPAHLSRTQRVERIQ